MAAALLLRRLGAALLGPAPLGEAAVVPALLHSAPSRRPKLKAAEEAAAQEWEEEEDGEAAEGTDLRAVQRQLKRQKKAILFQKMKRQMEPCVTPKRSLTRGAMEQIRQLNQEFPEEWTIPRLAEGFNVDSDVIRRVLRSKYSPSLERRMKQDAKVTMTLENRAISQGSVKDVRSSISASENLPLVRIQSGKEQQEKGIAFRHTIQDNSRPKAIQLSASTSLIGTRRKNVTPQRSSLAQERLLAISKQSHHAKSGFVPLVPSLALPNIDDTATDKWSSSCKEQEGLVEDQEWDGELLHEEELERLAESGYKSQMKVVQKGREFFDGDGNFLYSI